MNKIYPLRTVLTITTGRLLTEQKGNNDNGISDLYEILEHMTGEAPYTHSLGRFAEECKPLLFKLFPDLKNANTKELDRLLKQPDGINTWLKMCETKWGMAPQYSLAPGTVENHEHKNPVTELVSLLRDYRDG